MISHSVDFCKNELHYIPLTIYSIADDKNELHYQIGCQKLEQKIDDP